MSEKSRPDAVQAEMRGRLGIITLDRPEALNALCELMPKYPTLNAKATALKFIAVHLKAHNPRLRAPHLKHKYGATAQCDGGRCPLL